MNKEEIIRKSLIFVVIGGCGGTFISLLAFLGFGVQSPLYILMLPGKLLADLVDKSGSWLTLLAFCAGSFIGWAAVSSLALFIWHAIKQGGK